MKTKSRTTLKTSGVSIPDNKRGQGNELKHSEGLFLLVFCLMVTGIAAAGYLSYVNFERDFRTQMESQLLGIATLKMNDLENWRHERLGDAEVLRRNSAFASLVQNFLEDPGNMDSREQLRTWLDSLVEAYKYQDIHLLDTDGVTRLSSSNAVGRVDAHIRAEISSALQGGEVVFLDFYRHASDQEVYLSLLVPIYAERDSKKPLGVLVMEIDPDTLLYPYLSTWPTISETAETLLARREGNDAIFLTPLRFRPEGALNLRIPLERTDILAVKAVLGETGVVEGMDYRGEPVIGAIGPVPDSPWFLVARMDKTEVFAPLRQRLWQTVAFFGTLILVSGAGLFIVWRQQRLNEYRARVQTLDELRASEERFSTAFFTSPVSQSIITQETNEIMAVNDACCHLFGYPREELIGASTAKLNLWEDPANRMAAVEELQRTGHLLPREAIIQVKSGEIRTVIVAVEPISWEGRPCLISSVFDITERKRAETELMQMKRLYATLSQVNQTIVRVRDQQELFDAICKVAVEFGGFRLAWIGLFDPQTGQISPVAEHGEEQNRLPFQSINAREEPYQNGLIGLSLQSGLAQFSEDIQTDARMIHWREAAIQGDYHSMAAVPIRRDGEVIGLLNLYAADIGFFTVKDEQHLLEEMGLDISFALDKMDMEARRRQAEEEQFRLIRVVESSLNEIYIFDDTSLRFTYVNRSALRNLGYSIEELRSMTPVDLKPEFTEETFREMIHPLLLREKDILTFETIHRRKNGVIYPVEVYLQLVETGGSRNFVAIIHDITERQRAEWELRENEEKFRTVADFTYDWEYWVGTDGQMIYVSPSCERIAGHGAEEFLADAHLLEKIIHPDDLPTLQKHKKDEIDLDASIGIDFRIIKPDGETRWINHMCQMVRGTDRRWLGRRASNRDITERRQAEEKLRESEERLRLSLHAANQGLYDLNVQTGEAIVNREYAEMLGYDPETFVETNAAWIERLHPDDREVTAKAYSDYINGLLPEYRVEFRQRMKDGNWKWILSLGRVVEYDAAGTPLRMLGTHTEITERKQAEERIRTQLERLASLRAIDTAIVSSTNLNMTLYVLLSQAVTRLKIDAACILILDPVTNELEVYARQGFHASGFQNVRVRMGRDIAGKCAFERTPLEEHFLTKEDFASLAPSLREEGFTCYIAMPLLNKSKVLGVLEFFEREHRSHDQDWIDFLNALVGQAAIAIDNFQLFDGLQRSNAMLERRVAERTWELHQTNAELERANRAKDEFLATMSHELRTPLNSILGLSESLLEQKRGSLNEQQQKSLQIIGTSGRHLLELINDILDLSKVDAGKFDIYPQIVEVDTLCQSSLIFVREQAIQKSISLAYEGDKAASKFQADPRRMKQILVNLLTNAVKFTPAGGHVTLQVRASVEEDLIQFSVVDDGIGIAPEDVRRLFQPFVQVDSHLNRQFEGTGLGLALVQKLTDLHGGSVEVESEIDKGSRFTINLPWHKDIVEMEETAISRDRSAMPAAEGKPKASSDKTKRTVILLAEDNTANILTVGEYLESHGYEITLAYDGWEAISKAEETNPDVILMDIQMPSLDGLEATRRLRTNPRFASTPIIAVTALAMPGDRERCLEAGANEYMSKPVNLKMLEKIIERMIEP